MNTTLNKNITYFSNRTDDVANEFIKILKEEAIFDEYIFETPLSNATSLNATNFEFKLKKSKGSTILTPFNPKFKLFFLKDNCGNYLPN